MKIVSPYGKHVTTELNDVYHVASAAELLERVHHFLAERYDFHAVHIEEVHVAFGIAIRFLHADTRYYVKFTGRANHRQPEALFAYFEYLRGHFMLVPETVRTTAGTFFENILDGSPYDVTYVMKALPGKAMAQPSVRRLEQCVSAMAAFHRLGASYRPKLYAKSRDLQVYFQEAREHLGGVDGLGIEDDRELLQRSLAYTQARLEQLKTQNELSKTHVHGDFRFCHILFEGETISGIIDAEHIDYAERVYDVCVGLVSHTNPARCLLLEPQQILGCLQRYDQLYPLNDADRRSLKAMMLSALLNELSGALLFIGTLQSEAKDSDIRKLWSALAHFERLPDDLGLAARHVAQLPYLFDKPVD